MKVFKDLKQYKELLRTNVKKDIRGKYKASFLGVLWSFVNPLLMVLIYAIVFPLILRVKEKNYLIFIIAAVLPWNFFTSAISQGTTTIVNSGNILKKVYFPREILPISLVTSSLVNFLISCIIIVIFLLFSGLGITPYILLFPIIVVVEYILILGIVFILSALNVYIRDTEYIVNFFLQMAFYITPILYSMDTFPAQFRWLLGLNPMSHVITSYRDIFYYQQMPNFMKLGIVAIIGLVLLVIGYKIFKKLEKGFAEEL